MTWRSLAHHLTGHFLRCLVPSRRVDTLRRSRELLLHTAAVHAERCRTCGRD